MKVAVVHDFLNQYGGAEKVLEGILSLYPDAVVHTLIYEKENVSSDIIRSSRVVECPALPRSRLFRKHYKKFLFLFPWAVEQFDLSPYDLIISSSYLWAKGALRRADALHICYCHTPMRQAWDLYYQYMEAQRLGKITGFALSLIMHYLRLWDRVSADRVDFFIANSENVRRRIQKHYRRDARVIYPPVETDKFVRSAVDGGYYLVVSRLVEYKKTELAVRAFNRLGKPLVVIGTGPEYGRLSKIARSNITLLGRQPFESIIEHYSKCRAFIFPAEEDLGITPIEAQASGKPVIAYGRGGAVETVIDGKTGIFFQEQSEESLMAAVERFEKMEFNAADITANAGRFDRSVFAREIRAFIESEYGKFKETRISGA